MRALPLLPTARFYGWHLLGCSNQNPPLTKRAASSRRQLVPAARLFTRLPCDSGLRLRLLHGIRLGPWVHLNWLCLHGSMPFTICGSLHSTVLRLLTTASMHFMTP